MCVLGKQAEWCKRREKRQKQAELRSFLRGTKNNTQFQF